MTSRFLPSSASTPPPSPRACPQEGAQRSALSRNPCFGSKMESSHDKRWVGQSTMESATLWPTRSVQRLTLVLLGLAIHPRPSERAAAVRRDWPRISFLPTLHHRVDQDESYPVLAKRTQQALQERLPQELHHLQSSVHHHTARVAKPVPAW